MPGHGSNEPDAAADHGLAATADHGRAGAHDHAHGGHEHLSRVPEAAHAAVYASRAAVSLDPAAHGDQLEAMVDRFITALSGGLTGAGCTLIGHVKGSITADGRGDLAFHATRLGEGPAMTGGFAGRVAQAELTVNVIVFGVDEAALPAIVRAAWSRAGGARTIWRS